ncbi:MAG: NADH:flavin oxidoreductase [Ilumatobacteraceae bacterium]
MTSISDPLSFAHGPSMPNRVMLAPLTNQQSHADGTLSDEEHRWLTMRATGGFGLTMTCASHVQRVGQGFAGQLGIFGDEHLDGLTRLARDLNATGTVSYVQLHHAGLDAPADVIGTQPVSASDDADSGARALTTDEVEQVTHDFVAAARRAQRAGFHGVELHGAHGYLIGQFLSAETNRRTDRYGGSFDNRCRLLLDIVDGVRAECGDALALGVRLSAERFGVDTDEMCELFGCLVDTGAIDLIDMSLWHVDKEPVSEHHRGRRLIEVFAELPRGTTRLAVAGHLRTPVALQRALDDGVDVVAVGRAGILHHDFARRATDPTWVPRTPPATEADLVAEGVSPAFMGYLKRRFEGFVQT